MKTHISCSNSAEREPNPKPTHNHAKPRITKPDRTGNRKRTRND